MVYLYLADYVNDTEITEFLVSKKSHRISPLVATKQTTVRSAVVWRHTPLSWAAGLLLAGGDDVSSRPAIGCRAVIRNLIDTYRIRRPDTVFRHLRPNRGVRPSPPPPIGVSKRSVLELRGKDQHIALAEYSRLVVWFLVLGQYLTHLWQVKGQIFGNSMIF